MKTLRNKYVHKVMIGFKMLLLVILFQNMEMPNHPNVAEAANNFRVIHAKELMGNKRPQSIGAAVVKQSAVKNFIADEVKASLPKKYKSQYKAVAKAILKESEKFEMDPMFVLAVIKTESNFDPEARGRFREVGLMQIKPDTAEWLARETNTPWQGLKTLKDPALNIRLGVKYLSYLREKYDRTAGHYITAYNVGETKLARLHDEGTQPVIYSTKVMKRYIEAYNKLLSNEDMAYALN